MHVLQLQRRRFWMTRRGGRQPFARLLQPSGRQEPVGRAAAIAPSLRQRQQFGVQLEAVIGFQVGAQLLDSGGQFVVFAEKHVWVLGDRRMDLNADIVIEDQRRQSFALADRVLQQLVAKLALGRIGRHHKGNRVRAQNAGF